MKSIPPQIRVGVGVFILESSHESSSNPRFIVGKRKGSHGSGTNALPGGHLEFGESPEDCAAQEVLEETGLKVSNIRFLTATNDIMEGEGKHYVTLFVVYTREEDEMDPEVLEPEKCERWEWLSWVEVIALVKRENEAGEGEILERKSFLPLLNLAKQRPDVIPGLA